MNAINITFLFVTILSSSGFGAAFITGTLTSMIHDQRSSSFLINKKCKGYDDEHASTPQDFPEKDGVVDLVLVEEHITTHHNSSTSVQNTFAERRHEFAGLFQISSLEGNHDEKYTSSSSTSDTKSILPLLFQNNKSLFDQEAPALGPFNRLFADFVVKENFEKGDGQRLLQKMEGMFLNYILLTTAEQQKEGERHPPPEKVCKTLSEALETPVGKQFKEDFQLMLLHGKLPERIITWPLGYAGDYLTIDWIYNNKPQDGQSDFALVMDEFILESTGAQAVRDRRTMLQDLFLEEVNIMELNEKSTRDTPIQITSMACGPAKEVHDLFIANEQISIPVCFNLIDLDASALDYVHDWHTSLGLSKTQIKLHQKNLLLAIVGREDIQLPAQDIIYSMGLIDYLNDKTVIRLLNFAHKHLKEGGRVVLGQFHTHSPCRLTMDALDWKLIYRNEDDMNRLFSRSKFNKPCCDFRYSSNGVQMLAFGIKKS